MHTRNKKNKKVLVLLLAVVLVAGLLTPIADINAQIGQDTQPTPAEQAAAKEDPTTGGGGAKAPGFWDIITSPATLLAWLLYLVLEILGVILAISAAFLNLVVTLSITHMKDFLDPVTGLGSGVNTAWQIIRDIINIVFVFLLLFVGINTILGSMTESKFSTKLIPKIILAALLINFSMFFTKVVIDASNILTIEFYNAAAKYDQTVQIGGTSVEVAQGLAGAMMANLHLTDFYRGNITRPPEKEQVDANRHILINMVMAIVAVLIAMFVFIAIAFMLLGRFVIFIILMITSPIMFMGQLLPQLKSQVDKWWSALLGQALFAPIFFAMLLVALTVVNQPNFHNYGFGLGNAGISTGLEEFIGGGVATLIKYFIVIFFLLTALVLAKKVSGEAGKGVADWSSKAAGGLALGGTAMLARNTLGRAGQGLANSATVGEWAERKDSRLVRGIGKTLSLTGNWAQASTFDTRKTALAGGISKTAGVDFGKVTRTGGLVGGQERRAKERQKREEQYAKNIAIAQQAAKVKDIQFKANVGPLQEGELDKLSRQYAQEQDVLAEMKGQTTQARKDLTRSTEALTEVQKKDAEEIQKKIKVEQALIAQLEAEQRRNPGNRETQAKLDRARARFSAVEKTLSPTARAWIDSREAVTKTVKQAKSQIRATEQSRGELLAASGSRSGRMTGDAMRKEKESPEDTIAKQIKKAIDESKKATELPSVEGATTPPTPPPGDTTGMPRTNE